MSNVTPAVVLVAMFLASGPQTAFALTGYGGESERYDFEEKPWVEEKTVIPDFPKTENLIEFAVGPTERNRFYVDGTTISIGADGIIRYVLVLKTTGGAINVTLEGMRCATRELKLIAVGRSDGGWEKILKPVWRTIENKLVNQHHAVLNRNFFCPSGHTPRDSAEARTALKRGKHEDAPG